MAGQVFKRYLSAAEILPNAIVEDLTLSTGRNAIVEDLTPSIGRLA